MPIVYLGLGSNLGDRATYIKNAISRLSDNNISVLQTSSLIETTPVGGPPQGLFLNAVVKASTTLAPFELLDIVQMIEIDLGRVRSVLNGPRTIDIDILLYDNLKLDTQRLVIPHPRMYEREFVMIPLNQINGS